MALTLPTIRAVSLLDSAFDAESMDDGGAKYGLTRDESLIREVPGKRLTWFHVRAIPTSIVSGPVLEAGSDARMRYRAFQYGVARVENLIDVEGVTRGTWEGSGRARCGRGTITHWTDDELDLVPAVYVQELGEVALRRCFLPPGSEPHYPLPDICRLAWAARVYRSAERLARMSTESSGAPASEAPSGGEPSGAPGGAAATASQTAPLAGSLT